MGNRISFGDLTDISVSSSRQTYPERDRPPAAGVDLLRYYNPPGDSAHIL